MNAAIDDISSGSSLFTKEPVMLIILCIIINMYGNIV